MIEEIEKFKRKLKINLFNNWDIRKYIIDKIKKSGGWINCHSHLDRAYTLDIKDLNSKANAQLSEKWKLVDDLKREARVSDIYDRMAYSIDRQIAQGVRVIGSFIDIDQVIKDKALKAAERIRKNFNNKEIKILFINQTLKGVLHKDSRKYFKLGALFCDIVGGLPGTDRWFEEEHLDIVLSTARKLGKMVHVHVDQLNTFRERETEILASKTIEHGMQGRVVAIHSVSLSSHPYEYRRKTYRLMREAKIMVIVCPTAWIDSKRSEDLAPIHNAIAPVEELTQAGIRVGLGTDNIADIYKPFTDGDMWTELRFLLESCHFYDLDQLVKIATQNGRMILGINNHSSFIRI